MPTGELQLQFWLKQSLTSSLFLSALVASDKWLLQLVYFMSVLLLLLVVVSRLHRKFKASTGCFQVCVCVFSFGCWQEQQSSGSSAISSYSH